MFSKFSNSCEQENFVLTFMFYIGYTFRFYNTAFYSALPIPLILNTCLNERLFADVKYARASTIRGIIVG